MLPPLPTSTRTHTLFPYPSLFLASIVMLAVFYCCAEYGGSISSILLTVPGTPANAITCLDGHPMAKQGRASVALFMTTVASFIGGSIGILVLSWLTPVIVDVAMAFGPAEYFPLLLFCLVAVSTDRRRGV